MGHYVKKFDEINKDMSQQCGGKASHLGELTCLRLNVPKGFCVTADAFFDHLKHNGLEGPIEEILLGIDFDNFENLEQKTGEIRSLIHGAGMLPEIEEEITENYHGLLEDDPEPFVAVRSSVAVKDSLISSFPGMMDTYYYLRGAPTIIENVKNCWASVWSARAASTRNTKEVEHFKAIIAPVVQKMVNARTAGVMFTLNPLNGDRSKIVIEGSWGLGESVVSGALTPDQFIVDKVMLEVNERNIFPKAVECVFDPEKCQAVNRDVAPDLRERPCLEDREIKELVGLAKRIEKHYGYPQDIEWAIEKDLSFPENVHILQARAESVWSKREKKSVIGGKTGYELLMEKALSSIKVKL